MTGGLGASPTIQPLLSRYLVIPPVGLLSTRSSLHSSCVFLGIRENQILACAW